MIQYMDWTACCPCGKGVVKSRSLLGHFHRLHSPSGSQKAHKQRDTLSISIPACGTWTGFYNQDREIIIEKMQQI